MVNWHLTELTSGPTGLSGWTPVAALLCSALQPDFIAGSFAGKGVAMGFARVRLGPLASG